MPRRPMLGDRFERELETGTRLSLECAVELAPELGVSAP